MAVVHKRSAAESSYEVLQELQAAFGVSNDEEVVRKALSLARPAARHADPDGKVLLTDQHNKTIQIKLRD